uniref:PNPLA domain-containing protein n=1 Tax=Salix viminalis TaxID=40686 RepID=A0A6N2MJ27_SALVM
MDALLSDICIGTSAAPTYLPAHYFETKDPSGKVREFNLIDGGVAANNPTLVAMSEVSKEINRKNPDLFPTTPMDYGTAKKSEEKYVADEAAKWGILGWLTSNDSSRSITGYVFTEASDDMVDLPIPTVFQALHSEETYLRIQDC